MAEGHEKLVAWQKAIDLAESVYWATQDFPSSELYGSVSQMRRSSSSIAANIAEGYGRVGRGEYLKHLGYARGSAFELQTHMVIARRVGLLKDDSLDGLYGEVVRLLSKLIASLQTGYTKEEQSEYGDDDPIDPPDPRP